MMWSTCIWVASGRNGASQKTAIASARDVVAAASVTKGAGVV